MCIEYLSLYIISYIIYEVKIVAQACIQKISELPTGIEPEREFRYFLNTTLSNNLYFTYIQAYNIYIYIYIYIGTVGIS